MGGVTWLRSEAKRIRKITSDTAVPMTDRIHTLRSCSKQVRAMQEEVRRVGGADMMFLDAMLDLTAVIEEATMGLIVETRITLMCADPQTAQA